MLTGPTILNLEVYRLSLDIPNKQISINFTLPDMSSYIATGGLFWLLDPDESESLFHGFAFINPLAIKMLNDELTGQYIRFVHPETLHPLNALYLQKIGIQVQLMTHSGNRTNRYSAHLAHSTGKRLADEPIKGNLVTFVDLHILLNATVSNQAG